MSIRGGYCRVHVRAQAQTTVVKGSTSSENNDSSIICSCVNLRRSMLSCLVVVALYVKLHTHRIEMKTLNICSFYILDCVSRSMNNKNVHFHMKNEKKKKTISKLKSLIGLPLRKIRPVHFYKGNITFPLYQYRLNRAGLTTCKGLYTIV